MGLTQILLFVGDMGDKKDKHKNIERLSICKPTQHVFSTLRVLFLTEKNSDTMLSNFAKLY